MFKNVGVFHIQTSEKIFRKIIECGRISDVSVTSEKFPNTQASKPGFHQRFNNL